MAFVERSAYPKSALESIRGLTSQAGCAKYLYLCQGLCWSSIGKARMSSVIKAFFSRIMIDSEGGKKKLRPKKRNWEKEAWKFFPSPFNRRENFFRRQLNTVTVYGAGAANYFLLTFQSRTSSSLIFAKQLERKVLPLFLFHVCKNYL